METEQIGKLRKIIIVSQMFYPDFAATAKVLSDIAVSLRSAGYIVQVICQNRSYLNPNEKYPDKEIWNGIDISRVEVPKMNKNSIIQKFGLLLFFTTKALKKTHSLGKGDVYITVSNPPWMGFFVSRIARKNKKPFVFILHDLYPDVLEKLNKISKFSLVYLISRFLTKSTLNNSQNIIVIGRDVVKYLKDNYQINKNKLAIITNWGWDNLIEIKKDITNLPLDISDDSFVILYSGNLGEFAEFETLLGASEICMYQDPKIQFFIIGQGAKGYYLKDEINKRKLKNVTIFDYLPEEEYSQVLVRSDLLFVSLKKTLLGTSVPSKTYTYLSAGKPILAIVPQESEIGLAIKEDNFGITIPYDPKVLADTIIRLKQEPGLISYYKNNAQQTFLRKYRKSIITSQFPKLIQAVLKDWSENH